MYLRARIKHLFTSHRQGNAKNIAIVSTPRSGTTWLAEMIATQDNFKIVNEPFNLRKTVVRDHLGLSDWSDLFQPGNADRMRRYLEMFVTGRDSDLRFPRERPFSTFWHPVTNRVLFKILFAWEDCVAWFQQALDLEIVVLLRHPVPVSLSRKELPRLASFLSPPFRKMFSQEQLQLAIAIRNEGDPLLVAVLDWCLQNEPVLRQRRDDWTVVCYEQLVMAPTVAIPHVARRLSLPRPETMLARANTASRSTGKSGEKSRSILLDPAARRVKAPDLIRRWQGDLTSEQISRVQHMLDVFRIDAYVAGSPMPTEGFLLGD